MTTTTDPVPLLRHIAQWMLRQGDPDGYLVANAADELKQLRRWKAEALTVLAEWEDVWVAAGRPGDLGRSKAAVMFEFVRRALERPS